MVQVISKSALLLSVTAPLALAQSLLTPVQFIQSLEIYFYFRSGDAIASLSDEGITIEGSFASREDFCETLNSAQIVYSADHYSNVLLTSNCYNVFNLVDGQDELIDWDSCEEFSFYDSFCGSIESSSSSETTSTAAETSVSDGETLVLSTVTTTIHDIATTYTTWCPIDEATHTEAPVTSVSEGETLVLSTVTTTIHNLATTYTTWCPIDEVTQTDAPVAYTTHTNTITKDGIVTTETVEEGLSAIVGGAVGTTITDIAEYELQLAQGSSTPIVQATSESAHQSAATTTEKSTVETTVADVSNTETESEKGDSTVLVGGGGAAKTQGQASTTIQEQDAAASTSTQQQQASASTTAVISTFEGKAVKVFGSLSALYIVGTFVGFFL
jgi:hypothetical protein